MLCRHTVPDWHRHVNPTAVAAPIFAACRLLVGTGASATDPRSIACGYWGHQRACPVYAGPGAPAEVRSTPTDPSPASEDVPVAVDAVWPVRAPGATDGMRLMLIGLGVLSMVLLVWTAVLGFSALSGKTATAGHLRVPLVSVAVSTVTLGLATLRAWARR